MLIQNNLFLSSIFKIFKKPLDAICWCNFDMWLQKANPILNVFLSYTKLYVEGCLVVWYVLWTVIMIITSLNSTRCHPPSPVGGLDLNVIIFISKGSFKTKQGSHKLMLINAIKKMNELKIRKINKFYCKNV